MEKILTQEEINALLRSAQDAATTAAGAAKTRKFSPFVFGKASRITKQQVRDVAQVHEVFTYRLKNRLAAYLQVTIDVNPMSVDEVVYSEFIQSIPQQTFLVSLNAKPTNSIVILSLDLPVAFAMIDLMLGGSGKTEAIERHTTEIEERVFQTVLRMICEELQTAWGQFVEIHFSLNRTQRPADLYRLMPPYEKILFLSFEIRMPDVFSTLTLAFPAAISSLLLRKLAMRSASSQGSTPESQTKIRERLQDCILEVELLLPPTLLRGKDLIELTPGQTILIQHHLKLPGVIKVAKTGMFAGFPVRKGDQRGALIQQRFPVPIPTEKVTG